MSNENIVIEYNDALFPEGHSMEHGISLLSGMVNQGFNIHTFGKMIYYKLTFTNRSNIDEGTFIETFRGDFVFLYMST